MSDIYWPETKLLCLFDGPLGQKRVVDAKHHHATAGGDASLRTSFSKFGGSSMYFDGTGDYIQVTTSPDWDVTNVSWTVECWVKVVADGCLVTNAQSNGAFYAFNIRGTTTGVTCTLFNTSSQNLGTASGPTVTMTDAFHHVAVVRNGTSVTVYIDGVGGTPVTVGTVSLFPSTFLWIGSYGTGQYLNGYVDSVRLTKGVARYTANFTPPTVDFEAGPQVFDADYDKVVLHCHFSGESGSNTFIDQKGRAITPSSGVSTATNTSKFGGSSLASTDNGIRYISTSGDNLGTSDFTIEFFMLYGGATNSAGCDVLRLTNAGGGEVFRITYSPSNQSTSVYVNGAQVMSGFFLVAAVPAWHHIAVVREGATLKVYRDGAALTSYNIGSTNLVTDGVAYYAGSPSAAWGLYGYMDELRVTKGKARYLINFTPPTEPFPDFTIQKLSGTVRDPSGTPISRTVRSYRASDGLYVDTAVSDPTTGAFQLRATDVSEHFVVVHDPVKNALIYDHIVPVV